jgi:hypothetical protein
MSWKNPLTRTLDTEEESKPPVRAGLLAGILATLTILVIVAEVIIIAGLDVVTAARITLTVFLGEGIEVDLVQVVAGTLVHIVMSAIFGALLMLTMPPFPRPFWPIVGMCYGVVTGGVAYLVLRAIAPMVCTTGCANAFTIVWINVVYGFLFGMAAATFGFKWRHDQEENRG